MTKENKIRAAVLWTGGKDSALALHEARQQGYEICCLVTFAPKDPQFLAHSLPMMDMQAEALGLPHHILTIEAPFDQSYECHLKGLKDNLGIECVVTGDIAPVHGAPNWIRERCRPVDMAVHTPLWGRDRQTLLNDFIHCGLRIVITCVHTGWLDASWVGRTIDDAAIDDLCTVSEKNGLDLCGEQGEYHTMVVDGPDFGGAITVEGYAIGYQGDLAYMDIEALGFSMVCRQSEGDACK
ncbi:diphthine--ammonia ligase [Thaumasiovibrio subtropicus]|uniref:Dph6-related ATP pyrophosphatase n=1 Tax=Thaumasiovibrio subtropicus TaxID=1891207 RepID=UPI000B3538DE|nr:diphthine--ammonia ligase [Thaumasiovibrio subtropicus]